MADIFSKIQELVWWALSYPVPWVWIGLGMAGLVGLISVVGMVIGFKMKRDDRETAQALKATSIPPTTTGNAVMTQSWRWARGVRRRRVG